MSQQFYKVKKSITLDIDVYAYVEKLAEEESRNVSQQINKIIKDHMKSKEEGE